MNVRANSLSDIFGESDDAATDAARRMNWTNTRAPRNQPKIAKPGTPGPIATRRSGSSGFKPAISAGGFRRRILNKRETTAVGGANAAIPEKDHRSCPTPGISNSAIQVNVAVPNDA